MDGKKVLFLLFIAAQLNRTVPVQAQGISEEQSNLLRNSFSSDFEFIDNTSTSHMLLAEASDCDCCCDCNCNYCDCQCQCVQHCAGGHTVNSDGTPLSEYHFYYFLNDPNLTDPANDSNVTIKQSTLDGDNYGHLFELNPRILESQYAGIEYTAYTPIFNFYTPNTIPTLNGTYAKVTEPLVIAGNFSGLEPATQPPADPTVPPPPYPADMIATYYNKESTLSFYTSKYTKKVTIKIAGDAASKEITLERATDGSGKLLNTILPLGSIPEIPGMACTISNDAASSGQKIKWTFTFKLQTYGLFSEPKPNDDYQQGSINIVDAWDFNDVSYKAKSPPDSLALGSQETAPPKIYFYVKQPKLYNFKITKVNDIYWKDATIPAITGSGTAPLKTNNVNKRFISMGYLLNFAIDSVDFAHSQIRQIDIIPRFYSNGQEVKLYYDDPTNADVNKKYNNPIDGNDKYSKITMLMTDNGSEKIIVGGGGTDIIRKIVSAYDSGDKEDIKTWKFVYYLPPLTKAFAPSVNPAAYNINDPAAIARLDKLKKTGLLEVRFYISGIVTGNTNANKSYEFYNKPGETSKSRDKGGLESGGVFYYNLDWNALKDYSTQGR